MRAILVGEEGERDRVRWQLEGSSVAIVGEFASLTDARASGIEADAFVVAAASATGRTSGRARSSTPLDGSDVEPWSR